MPAQIRKCGAMTGRVGSENTWWRTRLRSRDQVGWIYGYDPEFRTQMVHDTARDGKVEAVRSERVTCDEVW